MAPPPVFRSGNIDKRFSDHIQIFINQNDVVPRASLHTVARLFAADRSIDQLDLQTADIIKIFTNIQGKIENVEIWLNSFLK